MGPGEGISTIWQDDESPFVNECTAWLSLLWGVLAPHLEAGESSLAEMLNASWGAQALRGGVDNKQGAPWHCGEVYPWSQFLCSLSVVLSLDWQVPLWTWAATSSSTALAPLLRQPWWVSYCMHHLCGRCLRPGKAAPPHWVSPKKTQNWVFLLSLM